jgi:hypothetical protein
MKTIEEKSNDYMSTIFVAETDNLGAKHIAKRAFIAGAQEVPKHKELVLGRVPKLGYPLLFAYDEIQNKWYQYYEGDFTESGDVVPIEWRPIAMPR